MKKNYFTLLLCLALSQLYGQTWEYNYVPDTAFWGGQGAAFNVVQTQDGGYLMAGELDLPTGAIRHYIQLIKADENGTEQWRKIVGANYGDVRMDQINEIHEIPDGNLLLGGSTVYNQQGLYIVKMNAVGDTIWTKVHNTGTGIITAYTEVSNYEYLSLARSNTSLTLYRTDTLGNISLQKTLDEYFVPNAVAALSNGDYIIVGHKDGGLYLMKTNTLGDTIWTKSHFYTPNDAAVSVQPLPNGDFIVGGFGTGIAGQSALMARFDGNNGTEVWQNYLPVTTSTTQVSDIVLDSSGNCLVTGSLRNFTWLPFGNGFVASVSQSGQTLWIDTLNNTWKADGASIISPHGDCYVIAGGSQAGYYLKNTCGTTSTFEKPQIDINVTVAPNPATDFVRFTVKNDKFSTFDLKLYDVSGRIIHSTTIGQQYDLSRNNLPKGIYFYGLFIENQLVGNGKIVFE